LGPPSKPFNAITAVSSTTPALVRSFMHMELLFACLVLILPHKTDMPNVLFAPLIISCAL
jgi:hypothetical protein